MEVLTSARSTVLLDFRNLEKLCSYESAYSDSADFQFFSDKNILTQINKKNGLEFLQIRSSPGSIKLDSGGNENYNIHRLRKMKIENLYCVAPLKAYEIALGMSNGEIRVLNYKSNDYICKFASETSKHSVISLDYSSLDEHLASVYENGSINIYGMKTKAKIETVNLDGNSTLARFNPKKRLRLAVASYKGSVFLYDIQASRKVFQAVETHSAPCRDIAMTVAHPDLLYSAGYDSLINIYDVRKKARSQQVKCRYPLSSISISECGTYCCAGNLKGEIISYDLRLLKKPLLDRKIHDSAVIRVAFVPSSKPTRQSSIFPLQTNQDMNTDSPSKSENVSNSRRDSFYDYIEFQNLQANLRNSDVNTNQKANKNRESFDWEQLATKRVESDRRLSSRTSLSLVKKRQTSDFSSSNYALRRDSLQNATNHTSNASETNLLTNSKIVEEENENEEIAADEDMQPQNAHANADDEEQTPKDNMEMFLKVPNENGRSSTPNDLYSDTEDKENHNQVQDRSTNGSNFELNIEILNQIKSLKLEMDKKFQHVENEIKFNAESNKWNLYSQNCNFWNKQNTVNENMCDALDILLHSDDFYQDYCRLKEENEQLKQTIEALRSKKSF